jgi:hypothetical protein
MIDDCITDSKKVENKVNEPVMMMMDINVIVQDPRFQVRKGLDKGMIGAYARAYQKPDNDFPPIQVVQIGTGYVLVDGWHRLAAQQSIGVKDFPRIYKEHYASEGRKYKGETKEKTAIVPDLFAERAQATLEQTLTAFKGISDPVTRGNNLWDEGIRGAV